MKQRDWFDIGVRLIGVWQIAAALDEFVTYADVMLKLFTPAMTKPNVYMTHGCVHLLIGFALLVSTRTVSGLAYGPDGENESDTDS